jgi:hypothetical protein
MHLGSFIFEGQLISTARFLSGAKFAGKRDICGYRFTSPLLRICVASKAIWQMHLSGYGIELVLSRPRVKASLGNATSHKLHPRI